MTRDVLPGSRNKRYDNQRELVADHAARTGLDYRLPGALEALVVILLHHVRNEECLYGDDPWMWTSCLGRDQDGWSVVVGGFFSEGFSVDTDDSDSYDDVGAAGLRSFRPLVLGPLTLLRLQFCLKIVLKVFKINTYLKYQATPALPCIFPSLSLVFRLKTCKPTTPPSSA